jgi:cysteine desulfurase
MSGIASNLLRQASRHCLKQSTSAAGLLRSSATARVAGISPNIARRRYVSATTKDSAQVNVDTAIRADHKAFFAETGKLPENEIIPGTSTSADAMMSPMAGTQWSMEEFNRGLRFCRCT